ncbi:MAG: efflux RND transporter periplasmic adaptor subunit [Blastocatellia bacterium]|nr:efflux RND transporter periplasmic adaptor subunit [Blastocatellia bacterium]
MSVTETPEKQPAVPANEAVPAETGVAQNAEPVPLESQGEGDALQSTRKRHVLRWVVCLLLIGLAVGGYAYRTRWLKLFAKESATTATTAERKVLYWVDPMHPAYKSDKPGTAPDCGMDLVPVYEEGATTQANLPEGAFQISPEKQQLIGVQYGEASYQAVTKTIRAVGKMAYDETKITRVHPRIEGWIEEVFVDFTGKQVSKGQPLISLYSPELWQTQQEYLLALKGRNELASSSFREAVASSASLLEAARKRLELWDIDLKQLEHLEHTGKPFKTLTLYAPSNGFILTRNAFPKQRVTPEVELYAIADLSTIWVLADIYEYEASEIKLGQAVSITLPYGGGRPLRGKVAYIYPHLDNTTRTLKVRIEVPNPKFTLKPDMYANVEITIDYGKRLVVPQEAVLDSGAEQTIFIAHEGGYFEPRKVQLGAKVDNNIVVLSGLKAGERVVTSANFLIDSESKLKSAASGMGMLGMDHGGGAAGSKPAPQADHSQHQPTVTPTPQPKTEDHFQHQMKSSLLTTPNQQEAVQSNSTQKILYWTCTMHPEVQASAPGKCPKCGMKLIPKYADENKASKGDGMMKKRSGGKL